MSERSYLGTGRWQRPDAFLAVAALSLVAYVAVRAWKLSFVHDESLTYTRLVGRSLGSLIRYDGATANHHLVNTLVMKAADATVGSSELALRAGSVVAGAVYLAVLIVWASELRTRLLGALGFILAAANPFVLDYLGLARGYALGLAGVAAAALFAVRYARGPNLRDALVACSAGGAAVLAHFGLLPFFVSLCGLLLAYAVLARRRSVPGSPAPGAILVALCGVAALLTAVIARPLLHLRRENELYVGTDSLWETLSSLVDGSLYAEWPSAVGYGGEGAIVALGGMVVVATIWHALRPSLLPPASTMLGLLVLLSVAISVGQHYLLDVLYPVGRTGLFLVPLSALWLCTAADELVVSGKVRPPVVRAGAAALIIAAAVNLAAAINVSYTYDTRYDADTERIVGDLDAAARARFGRPARVAATWQVEPTINFYRVTKGLEWVGEVAGNCRTDCLEGDFDAYVVFGADVDIALRRGAVVARRYPTGGVVLLWSPRTAP